MNLKIDVEFYPKVDKGHIDKALRTINENKNKWDKPFFTDTKSYLDIESIENVSNQIINDQLENIIVLGTGGSIQTLLALKHLSKKKIFPLNSSRAIELKNCLKKTNPENSIVIPISRGGETLDINSTIGIFQKKGYNFLGLSSSGTMYDILKNMNCPILDVPDLSGRFAGSVSNVGIVPAYISGINVKEFINGLDEGYKIFMNPIDNLALSFSIFLYNLYVKGYRILFSMPYSVNLEGSVGLFVQEISESTGKDDKGIMGAYQSAPLCQHSVLEFLLGGSKGIVLPIVWIVENELNDLVLESSINVINGQSAQSIINYQADATFQALIEQEIPSAKLYLTSPDEYSIGNLIAFIQSTVYYLCLLINVNWANNPKVVIGKKICNDALKNKLPSEKRRDMRKRLAENVFSDFWK